jgi:hypothetical protein
MQRAAFRMPNKHMARQAIGDHFSGDIAGKCTALLFMAILRAYLQRAVVGKCG